MIHCVFAAAFGGWELILLSFVGAALAFWNWMIVDCANYEKAGSIKVCWLIVILIGGIVGAPLYYLIRKLPRPKDAMPTAPKL